MKAALKQINRISFFIGVGVLMTGESPAKQPTPFRFSNTGRHVREASVNLWKKQNFTILVGFRRTNLYVSTAEFAKTFSIAGASALLRPAG
jgi:hypothetical protein